MADQDAQNRSRRKDGKSKRAPAPPGRTKSKPADKPSGRVRAAAKASTRPTSAAEPATPTPPAIPTVSHRQPHAHENGAFSIVGIGASAGGLEALEGFMRQVPEGSGLAFVIVQHMDPNHKGMLVELLQRATPLPVMQAEDGLKIEPDHVYVIPPNKDISTSNGELFLVPPSSPRGLNLPIDFFFRSLAADQGERAIGVILSGMGSDGTLGLRAIKEKAGAEFVQALTSAKFDGMPRSVIDAGLADVVAPVEELPGRIIAYRRHTPYMNRPGVPPEEKVESTLEKVYVLLRAQTGNDFSLYKKSTVYRRIERRMGLHQLDSVAEYLRFLREHPGEVDLLFKELLIGVTSFFRDPAVWEHLKKEVMPALLSQRANAGVLRAWVPGCSTGEEAYSLAMVFREALEQLKLVRNVTLQIFATDLDREAIEKARQGSYPDNIAADVSPERLRQFFVKDERGFRVTKEIREMVVFAPQNMIMDPPFTRLDILSCRNLLIYLSTELQKKLIPLFHYSLNPGGVLLLGSAETVGHFTGLFAPLDAKTRLYRRIEQSMATVPVDFPSSTVLAPRSPGEPEREPSPSYKTLSNLQALVDRVLVQRFAPVGVLCNEKGDVLYISGRAGKYLEPAVGRSNLNVFAMARDGLRYELTSAFSTALHEDRAVSVRGVKVGTNGGTQIVDLTVQKLVEPSELRGTVIVVLADVAAQSTAAAPTKSRRAAGHSRLPAIEEELQRARDEIQTTREEMQTSQEELKSTNEELQSTNEELQSTNEELTTSKEEMQSMNEELQTVNHELQAKVDELSRSSNDMKNLLNSTNIATLFLDSELRVRRFTTPTAKIIKLIPGDTGRPVTDIATNVDYPELAEDAMEVLRTLVFCEKQVATRDGRWFTVRIMPYRTLENMIDGVVITFTEASAGGQELDNPLVLRQLADVLPNLVWSARPDGGWDYLSRQWVEYTGMPASQQLGHRWLDQVHPDDRKRVREAWHMTIETGAPLATELRVRGASGEYRWFMVRAQPVRDTQKNLRKWYGVATDIHELKRSEAQRQVCTDQLALVVDSLREGLLVLDGDGVITTCNSSAAQLVARPRDEVVGKPLLTAVPALRGTEFDERLGRARHDGQPTEFETRLELASAGNYHVRLAPQGRLGGLLIFLRRGGDPFPDNPDRPEQRAP